MFILSELLFKFFTTIKNNNYTCQRFLAAEADGTKGPVPVFFKALFVQSTAVTSHFHQFHTVSADAPGSGSSWNHGALRGPGRVGWRSQKQSSARQVLGVAQSMISRCSSSH